MNFSFLGDTLQLKNLNLIYIQPDDWVFLENLTNLETIFINTCPNGNIQLNLINNINLIYIEVKYCNLNTFPELRNIPSSLEYLNLSWNNIATIPDFYKNQTVFLVFLYRNAIRSFDHPFILFSDPSETLPRKYIQNLN